MNQYHTAIQEYLRKCEQRGSFGGMESVLEFLWQCYSAAVPVDDGQIRTCEEALRPILQSLPYDASNILFDRIADLCTAYQRAAFLEGIALGVRLRWELES